MSGIESSNLLNVLLGIPTKLRSPYDATAHDFNQVNYLYELFGKRSAILSSYLHCIVLLYETSNFKKCPYEKKRYLCYYYMVT